MEPLGLTQFEAKTNSCSFMKKTLHCAAVLWLLGLLNLQPATAFGQGTAFTYQGRLNNGGTPVSGNYALTFALFNTNATGVAIAGPVTNNTVGVTNGLFTITIDFGPGVFVDATNWLQIGVASNGLGSFTPLSPRQQLTPVPYAIFAGTAGSLTGTVASANLSGTYGNTMTFNNAGNSFAGTFAGSGAGMTNVNAVALNGLNATNFWQLGGNNVASSQFFGSTNDLPVRIRVNNMRALIITTNPADSANLIGGSPANAIDEGIEGAVIAGGGTTNFLGTSSSNHISANFSSVGGGSGNWIQGGADHAVIANGWNNLIASNAFQSVIAGGENNTISNAYAIIGGGMNNTNSSYVGTISGGQNNLASGQYQSTVGGGYGNQATNSYATVPGGFQNLAGGACSFAAGQQAQAVHQGAFVWADSQNAAFISTSTNQFNVRANGGVRFLTGGAGMILDGQSVLTNNQTSPSFSGILTAGSFQSDSTGDFVAGVSNSASGNYAAVDGGALNVANNAVAFIGGGFQNTNSGNGGMIGGGNLNFIGNLGLIATIGGGQRNTASNSVATIAGGFGNTASGPGAFIGGGGYDGLNLAGNTASGAGSVIGGGLSNLATNLYATVPGGIENLAGGESSFAAGQQAQATKKGSFVWADAEGTPFVSITTNQFNVRANGGVRFVTSGAGMTVDGQPVLTNNQSNPSFSGVVTASSFQSANSTFIGGGDNTALSAAAAIGGGTENSAGYYATIGGGSENTASGSFSSIVGGFGNTSSGDFSAIGGGYENTNSGRYATIAGGDLNVINAPAVQAFLGGGYSNSINGELSVVGGGYGNIANGYGAFVGGGGSDGALRVQGNTAGGSASVVGGGIGNQASNSYATVDGGVGNTASGLFSIAGGGYGNTVSGSYGTVAGGAGNQAENQAASISGGYGNTASGAGAFIGGGGTDGFFYQGNTASGSVSVIGGGFGNQAAGSYATVPGGSGNVANGEYSLAAGNQAQALHQGAFVWADSQNAVFSSTTNDQFLIRAQGGVGINMNNPNGASLYVQGNRVPPAGNTGWQGSVGWFENTSTATNAAPALRVVCDGGTNLDGALSVSSNGKGLIAEFGNSAAFVLTITNNGSIYTAGNVYANGVLLTSDRNAKENFTALDAKTVLAKVTALPVTEWNYKSDRRNVQHIGPMAQDFQAAFGLNGDDDKHISTVDESGVALAAIQGLNEKLNEKDAEIEALKQSVAELKQEMHSLAGRK